MESQVPRGQVRLMALMVIVMWWSYIQWIRPVMLPPRHENRLVFPPGALDPHSAYRKILYPRARRESVEPAPSAALAEHEGWVS